MLDADVDEQCGWRQRGPVLGKQVDVTVPCGEGGIQESDGPQPQEKQTQR